MDMSTEANKSLIHRGLEEGMNRRNFNIFDQVIGPDFVNHSLPAPTPGPQGFKHVVGMFTTAFPDLHVTVEDAIAEGDRVATRGFLTGTHKGPFMNVPPTGKAIKVAYIDMWRVADGKAVENWVQMDIMGLMQQLGAVPSQP